MTNIRDKIKDAIERQAGNGDWNGIKVDDGRYEGSVHELDIDADSIDVDATDIDEGTITVTASGVGTAVHKDSDGDEINGEYDVSVTAKINISTGDASIVGVVNDD